MHDPDLPRLLLDAGIADEDQAARLAELIRAANEPEMRAVTAQGEDWRRDVAVQEARRRNAPAPPWWRRLLGR